MKVKANPRAKGTKDSNGANGYEKTHVMRSTVATASTSAAATATDSPSTTSKTITSKLNTATKRTKSQSNLKAKRPKINELPTSFTLPDASKPVTLTHEESPASTTAASTATSITPASTCAAVSLAETHSSEDKWNSIPQDDIEDGIPTFVIATPNVKQPTFSVAKPKRIKATSKTASDGSTAAATKTPVVTMLEAPTTTNLTINTSATINSKANTSTSNIISSITSTTDASGISTRITSVNTSLAIVPIVSSTPTPIVSTATSITPTTIESEPTTVVPSTTESYEFDDDGKQPIEQFSHTPRLTNASTQKQSRAPKLKTPKGKPNNNPNASKTTAITHSTAEHATPVESCGVDADTSIEKGGETTPTAKPAKRRYVKKKKPDVTTDLNENVEPKKRHFNKQVNRDKLWSSDWDMSCDLCLDTQQREEKYRKLWTAATKEYNETKAKLGSIYKELQRIRFLTRPKFSRRVAKTAIKNADYASKESKAFASLLVNKRGHCKKDERDIVLKLHNRSFSLYNYMRDTHKMNLPHSSTVCKWRRKMKRRALELATRTIDEVKEADYDTANTIEPNEETIMGEDVQERGIGFCEEVLIKSEGEDAEDFIPEDLIEEDFMELAEQDFQPNEEDLDSATMNYEDIISESPENSDAENYTLVEITPQDHDYF